MISTGRIFVLIQVVAVNRSGQSEPSNQTEPQLIKATKAPPKIDRKTLGELRTCKVRNDIKVLFGIMHFCKTNGDNVNGNFTSILSRSTNNWFSKYLLKEHPNRSFGGDATIKMWKIALLMKAQLR